MPSQLTVSVGQYSDKSRKKINRDFYGASIPEEPQLTSKGIAIALPPAYMKIVLSSR